jgi:hypothetical protein
VGRIIPCPPPPQASHDNEFRTERIGGMASADSLHSKFAVAVITNRAASISVSAERGARPPQSLRKTPVQVQKVTIVMPHQ